jgi:hypothetical protein
MLKEHNTATDAQMSSFRQLQLPFWVRAYLPGTNVKEPSTDPVLPFNGVQLS